MKQLILNYLFIKYKNEFEELMVREFIGKTNPTIEEPAINFLANGKERLEPWFLHQSYYLQRKSVNDAKNAAVYQGALLYLSIMLKIINQKKPQKENIKVIEEKESAFEKMNKAFAGLKEMRKAKKVVKK